MEDSKEDVDYIDDEAKDKKKNEEYKEKKEEYKEKNEEEMLRENFNNKVKEEKDADKSAIDSEEFSFDLSSFFRKGSSDKKKGEIKEDKEERKEISEKTREMREAKKSEDTNENDNEGIKKEGRKKHLAEKKMEKEEKEGEDEFYIDWKRIGSFLKKDRAALLLLLIPIILTISIRIQPNHLEITRDWATSSVYNYYKNSILSQINAMYPNLPDTNKQMLVDKEFDRVLKEQGNIINGQIEQTSAFFKSKLQYDVDGKSYTYLGDLDSYFFLRYADNLLKKGMQGDTLINNTIEWDNHMLAPVGAPAFVSLHPYSIVWLYKIFRIFDKSLTTMQASFYVPLVFGIIAAIAAFFIGRRLAGNVAGLVSSVLVSINPMFLSRTMGSDTDVYNVAIPLLAVWMFIEGFEAKNNKQRILFSALTGFFLGIFSFAWPGWSYIFDFMLLAIVANIIFLLYNIYRNEIKKERKKNINLIGAVKKSVPLKNTIILTVGLLVSTCIFVTLFKDFTTFTRAPIEPIEFARIKEVVHQTLWPNVYLTVAEMNPGSVYTVLSVIGGTSFLILSLAGIVLIFLRKDEHGHYNFKLAFLLILWFAGTFYATLKGSRFSLLLIPPFAIASGVAIGVAYNWISNFAPKELKIEKYIVDSILILLIIVLLINPVKAGYSAGRGYIPTMNDAWYDTLTKIKNNSSENAIINSWWDFGHWFKYVADRAVTADGATQNSPQAFWLGRVLTTNDEHEAIAVLRMLDCGSNSAFEIIDEVINDTEESVSIVRKAIMLDRKEAGEYLSRYLNRSKIEAVLNMTHCEPPEDYFITSEDMVGKSGVWAHFGMWDFAKAKIIVNVKNKKLEQARKFMKEEYNYSDGQIEKIFYEVQTLSTTRDEENWVAPWPAYISVGGICRSEGGNNNSISCINNLQGQLINIEINLTTYDAQIVVPQASLRPYSFVYLTNKEDVYEKKYENSDFPFSIILRGENGNYETIISSPELAMSIFTRLFFLNGGGLKHFEFFNYEKELTGGDIYTWKVVWEGKENKKI